MTNKLEVIRAGAGSGKTYDLCRTVAEAVVAGLDPARIMATTFTKKAAAELKGRIQARLLAGDGDASTSHRHADRLELAAIGTVHSVAHFMLSRYAIEVGLSPRLEVIAEEAADGIVAQQLGQFAQADWQELGELAKRIGVDDLNKRLLSLLSAKRSNRIGDDTFVAQMEASTGRVCQLLAPLGNLHEATIDQLHGLINDALAAIDTLGDTTGVTETAKKKLLQLRADRIPLWGKYPEAARLRAGVRSGANAALDVLRNHAAEVRSNRRLHQDLTRFSELLAGHTIQIESGYRDYKTERGLVDFTDLEILFLDLLLQDDLADQIRADFDLVLVDEFQDTNPLQLAIFQALRRLAARNRWVGDPKQAIYGFRSTDPTLVNRVWDNTQDVVRGELPDNYRSQKGLVDFVGAVFAPVLGSDAVQSPIKPGQPRGLERWIFDTRNQDDDARALANGILQLREQGVRFGDIVVLERANAPLPKLASAFGDVGIPYLYESAGLLATREGAILLAGMRLVLDRKDSLAAATIKHLLSDPEQDTPSWIIERLQAIREQKAEKETGAQGDGFKQPWDGDADFSRLESINRRITSPHSACQFVIEALDLPALIPTWGNAAQRSSNVDSMLRHIREYESQSLSAGQAATLGGAILYLETLASEEADIKYPPLGHNAVTLMTYHSAKGLQWPVVILSGLDSNRPPDMWKTIVGGGGQDVDNPLDGRMVRAWTWPFGKTDSRPPKIRTGSHLEDDGLASPEGQEQAEREAEENLRLLYVGCTRAETKLVFAHRAGKYSWLESLPNIDSILDCELDEGEYECDDLDTTYVLRRLAPDVETDAESTPARAPKTGSNRNSTASTPSGIQVRRTSPASKARAGSACPPNTTTADSLAATWNGRHCGD